jgi:hypothetical protein
MASEPYREQPEIIKDLRKVAKEMFERAHAFNLSDDYRQGYWDAYSMVRSILEKYGK